MKSKLMLAVVLFSATFQAQAGLVQRKSTPASTGYYAGAADTGISTGTNNALVKRRGKPATATGYQSGQTMPTSTSQDYYGGAVVVEGGSTPVSTGYYAGAVE